MEKNNHRKAPHFGKIRLDLERNKPIIHHLTNTITSLIHPQSKPRQSHSQFVHETLNYVFGQLCVTVAIVAMLYAHKTQVKNYVVGNPTIVWAPIIATFATLISLFCCVSKSSTTTPTNFVLAIYRFVWNYGRSQHHRICTTCGPQRHRYTPCCCGLY